MLVFNSKFFDKDVHLVYQDTEYSWVKDIPKDGLLVEGDNGTFSEIAKIMGYEVEEFIPEEYKNMSNILNDDLPWYYILGKEKFLKMFKKYQEKYNYFIGTNKKKDIVKHIEISNFLSNIKPCVYNTSLIKDMEKDKIRTHITPHLIGKYLKAPKYSRVKTKTGRLTVKDGPNVLTMPAGFRKGIENGYSMDFISMEPNMLLAVQGIKPRNNLYETIKKEVFNDSISRIKVKIATMSALYGDNRNDSNSKKISEYFNVEKVIKKLNNLVKNDSITNIYGRLINLNGARKKHLLSLWLQSSATEASIIGFNRIRKEYNINPHWLIHDGLMFTYNDKVEIEKEVHVGIKYPLPIKVEKL